VLRNSKGVVMDKKVLDPDKVSVIHDFLSSEECIALIRRSEDLAYEPGTVADVVIEQVRNNERVLVDDPLLAANLSTALNHCCRLSLKAMVLSGSTNDGAFIVIVPGRPSSHIETGHIYGWRAGKKVK
jgi:hypothetical protein